MANDRDVHRLRRGGPRPHRYVLPTRRRAAGSSANPIAAHKTVREAREGSVVKNWEDGSAAASGAEDLLHAQKGQENRIPAGDAETAKGHTAGRRAEEPARRYAGAPAAQIQTEAAGRRPVP